MRFHQAVFAEFERRRQVNPRFSMRGFSRAIGLDHSTLSRMLGGGRPVSARTIARVGTRIGLSSGQTAAFVAREDAVAVSLAIPRAAFRPDSRWLASAAGISIDRVNVALQTLLRCGRLRMLSRDRWVISQEGFE